MTTLNDVKIVDPTTQDRNKFWSPMSGKFLVKFLGEGRVQEKVKMPDGEHDMFYVDIDVGGTSFTWSTRFRLECTDASILGQLKRVNDLCKGLTGVSVPVIVSGSGEQRRYFNDADTAKKDKVAGKPALPVPTIPNSMGIPKGMSAVEAQEFFRKQAERKSCGLGDGSGVG